MLNPWTHFERAQLLYKTGHYEKAIEACHKALTCIPGILGVNEWFQIYLLDGGKPTPVTAGQVAELYALTAQCYSALERWSDARLNLQAALRWDHSNTWARRIVQTVPTIAPHMTAPLASPYQARKISAATASMAADLQNRLTLVIITHLTSKLKRYQDLSPPSVRLISATYGSMSNLFGEVLATCPKWVCYDRSTEKSLSADAYHTALEEFCRQQNFDLKVFESAGLRGIVSEVSTSITTPYLLLVEHDWLFDGPPIPLIELLTVFDHHPDVNMVRFNKRPNAIAGYDFAMEEENPKLGLPLLRTVAHSNNPAVLRASKLREVWLPICFNDAHYGTQNLKATAFGLEEPLFKKHIQDVRAQGFGRAHKDWGTYLYGRPEDPARIIHLGE
ncbi:MAG: tetratricopeptide repeat protein [Desulfobacteraceae bacterium]|nr:tetratricopeptide repeat protein [Desulfobacteraceae bacterium]